MGYEQFLFLLPLVLHVMRLSFDALLALERISPDQGCVSGGIKGFGMRPTCECQWDTRHSQPVSHWIKAT
jgi:hypothetical protein